MCVGEAEGKRKHRAGATPCGGQSGKVFQDEKIPITIDPVIKHQGMYSIDTLSQYEMTKVQGYLPHFAYNGKRLKIPKCPSIRN